MPKLRLTYFDIHGGRGEVARLAFALADVPFEDDRVAFPDWGRKKPETPLLQVPVLQVDGEELTQSNAINRYVGRLTHLYPEDAWAAARCDEIMDALEHVGQVVIATFGMQDEAEKKAARERIASEELPVYLKWLAGRLEAGGGEYFVDRRLTIADLRAYTWVRALRSGVLDHIPADLADRLAPNLVQHFDRIDQLEGVRAYYARVGA